MGISFLLISLNGCSTKEFQTNNYFDEFTKDEILEAGKLVFLMNESDEYIIDSYRDRLEVTKIGMVFDTLTHKDFILRVKENECGTDATLKIVANLGMKKTFNHNVFEQEHQLFWDKIKFFISSQEEFVDENKIYTKNSNQYKAFSENLSEIKANRQIRPTKDMKECAIKNEFENGVLKSKSTTAEVENEAL